MISFKNIIGKKNEAAKPKDDEAKKKENIFGKTLNAGQIVKTKKVKYIEAKNKKMAYARLGIAAVALAVYSVFFLYGNVVAYLQAPAQIAELNGRIQKYDETILPDLKKTRDLHKAAYDEEFAEVLEALEDVFPQDINKREMISLLESFATEVDVQYPPFEFTSITLAKPEQKDGYQIIPVTTSIHSSLAGFDKFLTLVERSGHVYAGEGEDKKVLDTKIRLMSISNISINYRGTDEDTGKDLGVDFSVKLNIYSRIPERSSNN